MSLTNEIDTLLIAVVVSLVPIVPLAIGLLKTYLQVQQNRLIIDQLPTHKDVSTAIERKAQELLDNGSAAGSDSTGGSSTGGGNTPTGNTE